ncbi:MAG: hypothetical protein CMJ72_10100 [Planctomycetaceae bacterium]|nr:hypothetical protein [Planctomycetaceae bacterium]HCK41574.1 hypothetical protein [Planctomycetaceae bacterium]
MLPTRAVLSDFNPQMAGNPKFLRLTVGSLFFAFVIGTSNLSAADKKDTQRGTIDLAEQFLAGLRERGWHDTAIEYLDQIEEDPLASPEFIKRSGFERGVSWAAMAKQTPSPKKQLELISKATSEFLRYAKNNLNSRYQVEALSQAGNLFLQQSLGKLSKADRLPKQADRQRQTLQNEARVLMDQASDAYRDLINSCASQLQSMPKAAALQKKPDLRSLRTLLDNKQAETKFQLAKLQLDRANTFTKDSADYSKTLQAAAEEFSKLQEAYAEKLIGYYGRLYEGRCYQQLGKHEDALACFDDLIDQPIEHPDFRRLIARTYRYRTEILIEDKAFEDAIKDCRQWLNDSRSHELEKPEWLAIMFRLANAYDAQALTPEGSVNKKELYDKSIELMRLVARSPGEFQRQARAALASTGGSNAPIDVRSFTDAYTAGKDALDQMNSSQFTAKLAAENNPAAVSDLQQQVKLYRSQAIHYYETCLTLADVNTPADKLASARYSLCWLYWQDQRPHEAALLGEFLARRFPKNQFAPIAAKLALAAYERIYLEARQKDSTQSDYEAEKLASMAHLLLSRWPESEDATVAMNLLINMALRDNRTDDAEAMLKELPAANRAGVELSLGGSLWSRYMQVTAGNKGKTTDEQQKLKDRAVALLSNGYSSLIKQQNPSSLETVNVLYLAQALLSKGQFQHAVEVLEDPHVGPLTLVQQNSPAADRKEFIQEVYKAALRAYVSIEPPQREKAQSIMESLEKTLGDKKNASERLTRIYLSLGLQLQHQIQELSDAGKDDIAQNVAGAFEDLVKRIVQKGEATEDWKIQNWIAQTNLQIGQSQPGQAGKRYVAEAETAYRRILAKAEENPQFAPRKIAILSVRKRLGDCLLAQENFASAFDEYTNILKQKPTMLEIQQAAASTLQAWGIHEKNLEKIDQAIRGTLPQANKKNLVWGWLRLATIADNQKRKIIQADKASNPKAQKYHDLFFETRLKAIQARFAGAKIATGAKRKKQLNTALQSIHSMQKLYPTLGGSLWQPKYLNLLKQIEDASSGNP